MTEDQKNETDNERYERELREYEAKVEKAADTLANTAAYFSWDNRARETLAAIGIHPPEKPDGAKRIAEGFIQEWENGGNGCVVLGFEEYRVLAELERGYNDLSHVVKTARIWLADAIRKYGDERYEEGRKSGAK